MNDGDKDMVNRIKAAVERECTGCEFQDGKYCSWAKKQRMKRPPCQCNKEDTK